MQLVFFLKATRMGPKMAETKVVQKNANSCRSETKCLETGQDSMGSPKRGFFHLFLFFFTC